MTCASGGRCLYSELPVDAKQICPRCRQYVHGTCGSEDDDARDASGLAYAKGILGSPVSVPLNGGVTNAPVTVSGQKARYKDRFSGHDNDQVLFMRVLEAVTTGGQPSSRQSLQTTDSSGELMTRLQARHDRLSNCRKEAHGVGDTDEVNDYSTKMKKIQKEMDDLEEAQLDTARINAAAVAADAAAADNP
jgi:hypothetical protein